MTLLAVRRGDLMTAQADAFVLPAGGLLAEGELQVVEPDDPSKPLRIPAAPPVWQGGDAGEADRLGNLYERIVAAAVEHGATTIAAPSLGTGGAGFPVDVAAAAAVAGAEQALLDEWRWLKTPLRILRWSVLDDATETAYRDAIANAHPRLRPVRPGDAPLGGQTNEPTSATRPLPYERELTPDEVDLVRAGVPAVEMEEKWVVRTDGDRVRFLRSSTGYEIFTLRLRPRPDGAPGGILDQLQRCADPERFKLPDDHAVGEMESVLRRTLRLRD